MKKNTRGEQTEQLIKLVRSSRRYIPSDFYQQFMAIVRLSERGAFGYSRLYDIMENFLFEINNKDDSLLKNSSILLERSLEAYRAETKQEMDDLRKANAEAERRRQHELAEAEIRWQARMQKHTEEMHAYFERKFAMMQDRDDHISSQQPAAAAASPSPKLFG